MINLNEPNYYGVGKGFAQVIDTRGVENMYALLLQKRMMQEQKDTATINEMTSQYDPNKQNLRAEDIQEYNDLFTKWKGLYLNNKKLARNPASNPELYKEAEDIRAKMGVIAKESKEMYHTIGLVADDHFKNRDKYDMSAVEKMNLYRSLPTSKIKELNGGRLVTGADFELDYKQVDDKAASAYIKNYAISKGQGYKPTATLIQKGGEGGVPLFENKYRYTDEFTPEIVKEAADAYMLSYGNEEKAYNQDFKRMTPEAVAEVKNKVKTDFGFDMDINNGRDLQHATWITKYGKQWVKDANEKDEQRKRDVEMEEWNKKRKLTNADQRADAIFRSNLAEQKAINKENRSGKIDGKQDLGDYTRTTVKELKSGDRAAIYKQIEPMLRMGIIPKVLTPGASNLKLYTETIKEWNSKVTSPAYKIDESPENINKLFKNKMGILRLSYKDEFGKDVNYLIDPESWGADDRLHGLLNKNFGKREKLQEEVEQ